MFGGAYYPAGTNHARRGPLSRRGPILYPPPPPGGGGLSGRGPIIMCEAQFYVLYKVSWETH